MDPTTADAQTFLHRAMTCPQNTGEAQDIVVVIVHHLDGRNIYLPRDDRLKRAIYHAFTGSNHRELAQKSELTTAQPYNIIRNQRALRQPATPGDISWS